MLPDSTIVFTGDYTISNTGQRPLRLNTVTIRLVSARVDASLVLPDESETFVTRIFQAGDPALKGLFQIEPGERTIFPIRAHLRSMADVMFVLCEFTLQQKRTPGAYRGFYVKSRPARSQNDNEPSDSGSKSPLDNIKDSLDI